jgi:hypothetical protein
MDSASSNTVDAVRCRHFSASLARAASARCTGFSAIQDLLFFPASTRWAKSRRHQTESCDLEARRVGTKVLWAVLSGPR